MRGYQLALVALTTIAAENVAAFTPTTLRSVVVPTGTTSTYESRVALYASSAVETQSTEEISFPYDDAHIRFAYDEWRVMFQKGGFDPARFENFMTNYKTLTIANLQGRQQADKEGKAPPTWMSLNEYGDISVAEYEAMMRGEPLPTPEAAAPAPGYNFGPSFPSPAPAPEPQNTLPAPAPEPEPESQYRAQNRATIPLKPEEFVKQEGGKEGMEELERALEYMQQNIPTGGGFLDSNEVRRESRLRAAYVECRKAYLDWCEKYSKQADALRYATFSANYLAMREYAKQTGKELKLNEYADCTKDEYARIVNGPSPEEIARKQKKENEVRLAKQRAEETRLAQQRAAEARAAPQTASASYGSFGGGAAPVPEAQDQYGRPIRPTEPIRGTQVIQSNQQPRSTQLIDEVIQGDQSSIQGTQVVQRSNQPQVRGTEVIKPAGEGNARPTLVIQKANQPPVRPTEVIKKADDPASRRTVLIDENKRRTVLIDENKDAGGTPVILPDMSGPIRPTIVMDKKKLAESGYNFNDSTTTEETPTSTDQGYDDGPVTRGTYVVRKADQGPVQGTQVISRSGDSTPAARGTIVIGRSASSDSPFNFPFFNDKDDEDDIEETFRGRGTIVIRRQIPDLETSDDNARGTQVIKKGDARGTQVIRKGEVVSQTQESDSALPNIFSLFGGAKKDTEKPRSVRGTIVIQKNDATSKPRDSIRGTVILKKGDEDGFIPTIFNFFGGAKKVVSDPRRPTIVIKKESKDWFSSLPFLNGIATVESEPYKSTASQGMEAAQIAKQKAKATFEAKQKRLEGEAEKAEKQRGEKEKQAELSRARANRLTESRSRYTESRSAGGRPTLPITSNPFSLFGGTSSTKVEPEAEDARGSSYTLFGGFKKPKYVPEVTEWKQNFDGSITGYIYNSKNFKDGTRVTTSPVPRGAKAGTVVKTGSGSQYRLK